MGVLCDLDRFFWSLTLGGLIVIGHVDDVEMFGCMLLVFACPRLLYAEKMVAGQHNYRGAGNFDPNGMGPGFVIALQIGIPSECAPGTGTQCVKY